MSDAIVRTSDSDLAAFWLSSGLGFVEADAFTDPRRVEFSFRDPDHREREITRTFFRDTNKATSPRAVLQARRLMARALYRAKSSDSRRCTGEDLQARLWDEQRETFTRISASSRDTLRAVAGKRERR